MIGQNKVLLHGYCKGEAKFFPVGATCKLEVHLCIPVLVENHKDGTIKEFTDHVDVVVWGKQAEKDRYRALDGVEARVEGKLRWESWDDKKTGEKRGKTVVVADVTQFATGEIDPPSHPQRELPLDTGGGRDTTAPF